MKRFSRPFSLADYRPMSHTEWPTLALLALCYGLWFAAGLWLYPRLPALALIVMGVAVALHSSLQHEVLHGHPTSNAALNEALVFLAIGLFYPYRSYRRTHLQHHLDERLTDPHDDPESYYIALLDWLRLPRQLQLLLKVNNTMVGRVLLGPPLNVLGFTCAEWKRIVQGDAKTRDAWLRHIAGLVPIAFIVQFLFGVPLWLYAVTAGYLGLALLAIRSYCEHQWSESPEGRTIIVERSILAPLFLYNNLHFVHHKLPRIPWYRLPEVYRRERADWIRLNGGYVYGSYLEILRTHALQAKEPVVHPALRRNPPPIVSENEAQA